MAESTLSLGYPEFASAVGRFIGWTGDSDVWLEDETADIDEIVQTGLRQVYLPPPVSRKVHQWSWLKPTTALATVADQENYDLPDDNSGTISNYMTFTADDPWSPIEIIGSGQMRAYRSRSESSGVPKFAAISPKAGTGTTGQRFEIIFWPTPDSVYLLGYSYTALQNKISTASPYPLGGMQYGELFKASCLAEAERKFKKVRGIMWEDFVTKLASAVSLDEQQSSPKTLGVMHGEDEDPWPTKTYLVKYDGQTWS